MQQQQQDVWELSVESMKLLVCALGSPRLPDYLRNPDALRAHVLDAHDSRGRTVIFYFLAGLRPNLPTPTQFSRLLGRLYTFTSIRSLLTDRMLRHLMKRLQSPGYRTRPDEEVDVAEWLMRLQDIIGECAFESEDMMQRAADDYSFIDDVYDDLLMSESESEPN
jgi:hypothetical protein